MHQITPTDGQRIDDRNLYAPLRTDKEAQQQALHRGVWPLHRACNQNCNQGRACDCVAPVEIEEGSPRRQRVPEGGAIGVGLLVAVLITLYLIFIH